MTFECKPKIPSGKWIILLTALFLLFGSLCWTFRSEFGVSQVGALSFLALLGGITYAFTCANDQRVLSRRLIMTNEDEEHIIPEKKGSSGFLAPDQFIFWGGLLGAICTWVTFPIVYDTFSAATGRTVDQMLIDLSLASSIGSGYLGIPAFVVLGMLTFLSTLAYLHAVKESLLHLVFPTIASTALTIMVGRLFFGDHIMGLEFGIPLLVTSIIVFIFSNKVAMERKAFIQYKMELKENVERKRSHRLTIWLAQIVFVSADVTRSALLRGVLNSVDVDNKFFLAISLRTLYFSCFAVAVLVWFLMKLCNNQTKTRHKLEVFFSSSKQNFHKMGVVMITSLTFVAAYSISTPTFAYNLTFAPLIFAVSQILVYPLMSAWYFIGAFRKDFKARLAEVFGKVNGNKYPNFLFIFFYGLSLALCGVWIICQQLVY